MTSEGPSQEKSTKNSLATLQNHLARAWQESSVAAGLGLFPALGLAASQCSGWSLWKVYGKRAFSLHLSNLHFKSIIYMLVSMAFKTHDPLLIALHYRIWFILLAKMFMANSSWLQFPMEIYFLMWVCWVNKHSSFVLSPMDQYSWLSTS